MPLNTQVRRNGRNVKGIPWNKYGTLDMFLTVALAEGDPDLPAFNDNDGKEVKFGEIEPPTYVKVSDTGVYYLVTECPLWKGEDLTLSKDWKYEFGEAGTEDHFLFDLRAGDVLRMWRD